VPAGVMDIPLRPRDNRGRAVTGQPRAAPAGGVSSRDDDDDVTDDRRRGGDLAAAAADSRR